MGFAGGRDGVAFSCCCVAGAIGDGLGSFGALAAGAGGGDLDAACAALRAGEREGGGFESALVVATSRGELGAGRSADGAIGFGGFGGGDALSKGGIAGVKSGAACSAAVCSTSGALALDGCARIGGWEATIQRERTSAGDAAVHGVVGGTSHTLSDALAAFFLAVRLCSRASSAGSIGVLAGFVGGTARFGATIGGFGASEALAVGAEESLGTVTVGFAASGEGHTLAGGGIAGSVGLREGRARDAQAGDALVFVLFADAASFAGGRAVFVGGALGWGGGRLAADRTTAPGTIERVAIILVIGLTIIGEEFAISVLLFAAGFAFGDCVARGFWCAFGGGIGVCGFGGGIRVCGFGGGIRVCGFCCSIGVCGFGGGIGVCGFGGGIGVCGFCCSVGVGGFGRGIGIGFGCDAFRVGTAL